LNLLTTWEMMLELSLEECQLLQVCLGLRLKLAWVCKSAERQEAQEMLVVVNYEAA
jgi:hypothetical protein